MEFVNVLDVETNSDIKSIIEDRMLNKFCSNYITIGKNPTVLSCLYLEHAEAIDNFEVYNDDIWVASHPKSGTTWVQEMVWLIVNNFDLEKAKTLLSDRFPFLELAGVLNSKMIYESANIPFEQSSVDSINFAKHLPRPRCLKTHLPFSLLPKQIKNRTKSPKIIYIVRNPKDVCVSYYHHGCLAMGWKTNLEEFAQLFIAGKYVFGPYWNHVSGYWQRQSLPNLLIVKYEDMKSNLPQVIRQVAKFLEKTISEDEMQYLCQHLSVDSMKSNPALNLESYVDYLKKSKLQLVVKDGSFIRTGIVGKYKQELSPDTITHFNSWVQENVKGTDLEHEYIFQI